MEFQLNDGGRKSSGFKGLTGDCVCRAIAIASNRPYQEIYNLLAHGNATQRKSARSHKAAGKKTAGQGIQTKRKWFNDLMVELGFEWMPTMAIGSGCQTHLRSDELPKGRIVVSLSKHMAAVIDGVLNDLSDCSRGGTRCVYGYYKFQD